MRYFILFAVLFAVNLPSFAALVTKKDMLGAWQCTTQDSEDLHKTTTLDIMNADGSMYQLWEVVHYNSKKGDIQMIEILTIKNNWDLKNNKQVIKDWQLIDYKAYNADKLPVPDEIAMYGKQTWMDVYAEDYDDKLYMSKDKRSFYYEPKNGFIASRCYKLSK